MAIFMNKLKFKLAAVVTVFIVVSISGVQSQTRPTILLSLFSLSSTQEGCHSPFEYRTWFFTTGTVDGYSSELPLDVSSEIIGWFFDKSDGTCKRLYLRAGVKAFDGNKDFPKTKEECEKKCVKKPCPCCQHNVN